MKPSEWHVDNHYHCTCGKITEYYVYCAICYKKGCPECLVMLPLVCRPFGMDVCPTTGKTTIVRDIMPARKGESPGHFCFGCLQKLVSK